MRAITNGQMDGHTNMDTQHTLQIEASQCWQRKYPYRYFKFIFECRHQLEVPVEYVGLFSYLTYLWMDGFMWNAFRSGLDRSKLWTCPAVDEAQINADR